MKKMFAVMVAMVMVVALFATPVHAETAVVTAPDVQFADGETSGTDSYGRSYTQREIKDGRYEITGYYNHDAVFDYNVGWIEYRGLHTYLGVSAEMVKALGWRQAVTIKGDNFIKVLDTYENNDNDSYYAKVCERYPTIEEHWAWKAANG